MKKVIYGFFLLIASLSFVGCEDYNNPNEGNFDPDTQSGWVQFDIAETAVLTGSITEFSIPVRLYAPVNTAGLEVTYTVTDVSGSTAGLLTYTGTASVPKNSLTGNITFAIPQQAVTSCVEFMITLTGTSRNNVQVGLAEGVHPITTNVVLTSRDLFIGEYDVFETVYGDLSGNGFEYTSEVTAGDAPNELIVSNLWDADNNSETRIYLDTYNTITYPAYTQNYLDDIEGFPTYVSNDFTGLAGMDPDDASVVIPEASTFGCGTFTLNFFLYFQGADVPVSTDNFSAVFTKQ